jgi:hypothetical protein
MTDEPKNKSLEDMTVEDHLAEISKARPKDLPIVREDEATIDDLWKARKKDPEVRILTLAEIAQLIDDEDSDDEDTDTDDKLDAESDDQTNTDEQEAA